MVNTKTTKVTGAKRCPMCSAVCPNEEKFKEHVALCALTEYSCDVCDFTSNRPCNVKRHFQRVHKGLTTNQQLIPLGQTPVLAATPSATSSACASKSGDESDWKEQDPGALIENNDSSADESESDQEDSSVLAGRLYRKHTSPSPVASGRLVIRRSPETTQSEVLSKRKFEETGSQAVVPFESVSTQSDGVTTCDVGVQCEKNRKREKTITVTKYTEGGRAVEIIHEVEEFYNM
ncbi:hypothetical protein FSP39_014486 [Pinctada imbricata]|uniref:C2H2-type domain-containing protein n=1 Tax=Pinctada imbricata TaxID=66713 RepID=A0AA88XFR4_PINIB|nr:hypothetical protein FSP39_014486 [Pinctada imbricata]